jgi:hypothetical protein
MIDVVVQALAALGAGVVAAVLVAVGRAIARHNRQTLNRNAVHRQLDRMQQAPDRW